MRDERDIECCRGSDQVCPCFNMSLRPAPDRLRGGSDALRGARWDAAGVRLERLASAVVDDDVSKVRLKRLPGVPRTHLASLWFRVPCREPEVVVRVWGVILGSEPHNIEEKGTTWFIGAGIGRTGASFDFYPAPEKMTDLSRLVLDVLTEDLERTTQLAVERGGTVEDELRDTPGITRGPTPRRAVFRRSSASVRDHGVR